MYMSDFYISAIFSHCWPHKHSHLHTFLLSPPSLFLSLSHTLQRHWDCGGRAGPYQWGQRQRWPDSDRRKREEPSSARYCVCACMHNSYICTKMSLRVNCIMTAGVCVCVNCFYWQPLELWDWNVDCIVGSLCTTDRKYLRRSGKWARQKRLFFIHRLECINEALVVCW